MDDDFTFMLMVMSLSNWTVVFMLSIMAVSPFTGMVMSTFIWLAMPLFTFTIVSLFTLMVVTSVEGTLRSYEWNIFCIEKTLLLFFHHSSPEYSPLALMHSMANPFKEHVHRQIFFSIHGRLYLFQVKGTLLLWLIPSSS